MWQFSLVAFKISLSLVFTILIRMCLNVDFLGFSLFVVHLVSCQIWEVFQPLFLWIFFQSHFLFLGLRWHKVLAFCSCPRDYFEFFSHLFSLFRFVKFYALSSNSDSIFYHTTLSLSPSNESFLFFSSIISTWVLVQLQFFVEILYFFICFKNICNCLKHFYDGCFNIPVRWFQCPYSSMLVSADSYLWFPGSW